MKQELSSFSFIFYLLFVDQALSWTIYCNVSSSPFSEKPHARVIQTPLKELPLPPDDINLVQNQDLSCTFQRFKVVFTYSPKKYLDKLQRHASSYLKVMNLYSSTPHYHCVFECSQCYSSMTASNQQGPPWRWRQKLYFAKYCFFTGQKQACTRITRLFGRSFGCEHAEKGLIHRKIVVEVSTSIGDTLFQTRSDQEWRIIGQAILLHGGHWVLSVSVFS